MGFRRSHYGKQKHNKNGWYCSYKNKNCIHYETQKEAETALKYTDEYQNQNHIPRRVYHCGCGYWHLTSKPKKDFAA